VPSLLQELVRSSSSPPKTATPPSEDALRNSLLSLSDTDRHEVLLEVVRREIAVVLALAPGNPVSAERPIKEMGLDSLTAIELRDALADRCNVTLPATLAYDYPNARAIAEYLRAHMDLDGGADERRSDAEADQQARTEAQVRALLMQISIPTLRKSGLLDQLLDLAPRNPREREEEPAIIGFEGLPDDDFVKLASTIIEGEES
jgi:type I polyketide synthase PikAII